MHSVSVRDNAATAASKDGQSGATSKEIRTQPLRISRPRLSDIKVGGTTPISKATGPNVDREETGLWETVEVPGPDTGDKATVVNLAKMCNDAYIETPAQPDWLNTTLGFNHSDTFGWKKDGLRGHVFTDSTNDTVIVAFKGTSVGTRSLAILKSLSYADTLQIHVMVGLPTISSTTTSYSVVAVRRNGRLHFGTLQSAVVAQIPTSAMLPASRKKLCKKIDTIWQHFASCRT